MNQIFPAIRSMTFEEQSVAGLFSKGLMLEQGNHVYRLTSGTTDSIHVFEAGTLVYVLTVNLQLDYVSLDCYSDSKTYPADSIFLQGHHTIIEALGSRWRLLPLQNLVRRLEQYFS